MVISLRRISPLILSPLRFGVTLCAFVCISLLWCSLSQPARAQTSSTATPQRLLVVDNSQASSAKETGQGIGSVSFLIGKATLLRQGVSQAVTQGSTLQVGDDLVTQDNGHIHVRFIDGAMVSLRPSSLLKIKAYRFDPQNPSNSEVRFELEQGVVRAISGQAAESAKDKFRLNTPLAAIGVKGTDFVVEATQARVNAIVNQGAIVLAPFDAQCLASSTGPCTTPFAKELTAALKGMALTYNMSMPSPQLLPMGQLKGSELLNLVPPMGAISQASGVVPNGASNAATISAPNPTSNSTPNSVVFASSGSSSGTNSGLSSNAGAGPGANSIAEGSQGNGSGNGSVSNSGNGSVNNSGNSNASTAANNRVQQTQVDGQAYSTVNQILNRTVSDASLVWGRWGAPNPQDNLTVAFKDAMQNRSVTVGDGYFFLFRQENNVPNLLSVQQGNVNFALQSGYAYFLDLGNNVNTAAINSGTLGVNFSTLDVKTTLNLSAQTTPTSVLGPTATPGTGLTQTLSATAKLNPSSGIFLLSPGVTSVPSSSVAAQTLPTLSTPTVAGALSLDTKQAGYLFSLPTPNGAFKGGTLWAR